MSKGMEEWPGVSRELQGVGDAGAYGGGQEVMMRRDWGSEQDWLWSALYISNFIPQDGSHQKVLGRKLIRPNMSRKLTLALV